GSLTAVWQMECGEQQTADRCGYGQPQSVNQILQQVAPMQKLLEQPNAQAGHSDCQPPFQSRHKTFLEAVNAVSAQADKEEHDTARQTDSPRHALRQLPLPAGVERETQAGDGPIFHGVRDNDCCEEDDQKQGPI